MKNFIRNIVCDTNWIMSVALAWIITIGCFIFDPSLRNLGICMFTSVSLMICVILMVSENIINAIHRSSLDKSTW